MGLLILRSSPDITAWNLTGSYDLRRHCGCLEQPAGLFAPNAASTVCHVCQEE
jgi:hypothetical protein